MDVLFNTFSVFVYISRQLIFLHGVKFAFWYELEISHSTDSSSALEEPKCHDCLVSEVNGFTPGRLENFSSEKSWNVVNPHHRMTQLVANK